MTRSRNLNTWLLLLALAVMVSRVLAPFSVPPVVVHENGYIEICSWHGGTSRVLLDADGNQIESEQPFSHCPQCVAGTPLDLPATPWLSKGVLPLYPKLFEQDKSTSYTLYAALPPPSRAPPLS